jgi:hypothetical protein
MGEYRRYRRRRRQSARALTVKFSLLSVVVALAIGAFLAVQMAEGEDPALGPKATAQTQTRKASPSSTSPSAVLGSYSSGSTGSPSYSSGSTRTPSSSTTPSAPASVTSSVS